MYYATGKIRRKEKNKAYDRSVYVFLLRIYTYVRHVDIVYIDFYRRENKSKLEEIPLPEYWKKVRLLSCNGYFECTVTRPTFFFVKYVLSTLFLVWAASIAPKSLILALTSDRKVLLEELLKNTYFGKIIGRAQYDMWAPCTIWTYCVVLKAGR